jgi:hypothetical protein
MKQNETNLSPKVADFFHCNLCDYLTCKKSDFNKHLSTDKHKKRDFETNETNLSPKVAKNQELLQCDFCGVFTKSRTTLWRHKKECKQQINNSITPELIMELIKDNKELRQIILDQNNTITSLAKNGNNSITNSMNNNKTFNLQFFLNETCKDAMNIMDFVDSIKLQLTDLEKVGELGYVEGISNIITSNLKALDVSLRPVHCTDKKRETIYVKDDNKWTKEDDQKSKLRRAIKRISNKNIKLLPQYREKHPDYGDAASKISDKYCKMVIEAMGGNGSNNEEKEDKIIHNISKNVIIDKLL